MMQGKIAAATALAALLVAGSASAQGVDQGFYIGADGALASIGGIASSGVVKTSETNDVGALRVLAGYQFNKNLSVELGYLATGDFKQSGVISGVMRNYEIKARVQGGDLAAQYTFSDFLPGLYLKAGATYSRLSYDLNVPGAGSASGSQSGTGYLLGLGYEYRLNQNVALRAGYTRYQKVAGDNDNSLNLYSAGVKYKF